MRLLQAIAGAEYGGAEKFFVRLAISLQKANVDQKVIIRSNKARENELAAGGVDFTKLRFGGPLDWTTRRKFRQEVEKFKPNIVVTWMNRATKYFLKKNNDNLVHIARLGGYYDLKYYKRCDHLIGNTRGILEYLSDKGWPKGKANYLPNFAKSQQYQSVQRKAYFTPENAPVVVGMGRFHENKGFDVLIEALSHAPGVYLWLAGDGPLRNELEALAEKLAVKPRVRFLGWHENISPLLSAANIFVCASRHEPLGNVILEAWAHNVPVISTDSDGPGELVEHLVSGVLVPINNPVLLGKAIRNLLVDDRLCQKIIENGKQVFETHFTEEIVTQKYIEFFQGVMEKCAESPE